MKIRTYEYSKDMEDCDIPTGIKTCESNEKLRCKFCKKFVLGLSDYSFRCTKYHTKKQQFPILNTFNGKHMRLDKCFLENK